MVGRQEGSVTLHRPHTTDSMVELSGPESELVYGQDQKVVYTGSRDGGGGEDVYGLASLREN